jgi:dTMP kinase
MACFITFEGIEGCGKTTQVRRLADTLSGKGIPFIVTREPGGCPIADEIRGILLDAKNSDLTPDAELLLYAAARAQHVQQVIGPALAAGTHVLCDRFCDATVAYQGYGRGLDLQLIRQLNDIATGGLVPDLTLLLDCPVETGLGRALARINATTDGQREERFELESIEFHRRVRDGYLRSAAAEPGRITVVDGSRKIADIEQTITETVLAWFNGRHHGI